MKDYVRELKEDLIPGLEEDDEEMDDDLSTVLLKYIEKCDIIVQKAKELRKEMQDDSKKE